MRPLSRPVYEAQGGAAVKFRENDVPTRFDVVIAGGSYVGLTLALALARFGEGALRVAVIEAGDVDAAAPADPRASAITAASRHLLQTLALWPALAPQAQAMRHIEVTDTPLASPFRPLLLHFDAVLDGGEATAHMVENRHLRTVLLDAVASSDIAVLAPRRIVGFASQGTGVRIDLDDAASIEARLLVAADGRRSSLRRAAGIGCVGWRYPQSGIVVTVAHEKPHHGHAVQHFLPAGPFAILPLVGNRSSLVWTEEAGEAARIVALDDAAFLAELVRRFGRRLGELELAGRRAAYPLELRLARAFIADRLALVGDAAHVVHPLAGQGLNIGLRDVAALTEVVIEAARLGLDVGSQPVLVRYQRWRRFDSAFQALAMDGMNRLFSNDSGGLRMLRDFGLGLVDRLPALKQTFMREAAGLAGEVPRLLKGQPV